MIKKILLILFVLVNLLYANAATLTWNGSTSVDWNTPQNWSADSGPSVVPAAGDSVVITNLGSFRPKLSADQTVKGLYMDNSSGNEIDLNGFNLIISTSVLIEGGIISNGNLVIGSPSKAVDMATFGIPSAGPAISSDVNLYSKLLSINRTTFQGATNLTYTGTATSNNQGGNTFSGITKISNIGTGSLTFGNSITDPDAYLGEITFINSDAGNIEVATKSQGTIFSKKATFRNLGLGTASHISIAKDLAGTSNTTVTFNDSLILENAGSAGSYIEAYVNGTCNYNGNIVLNCTSGIGILFGGTVSTGKVSLTGAGIGILKSDKTITVGTAFSNGTLLVRNFIQGSNTASIGQNILLTGAALLQLEKNSKFFSDVKFSAPRIIFNGVEFNGITQLEKTGDLIDKSNGGNHFYKSATITNGGTNELWLGSLQANPDTFKSDVTFINSGTSGIDIGDQSIGNVFEGEVNFNNMGKGSNSFIRICEGYQAGQPKGTATFKGTVTFRNTGTGTFSIIKSNTNGTCSYLADIKVASTIGLGILFGDNGGTATLEEGKKISLASEGFTAGNLKLKNFTQGNTPGGTTQSIKLSGTAILSLGSNSVFNGAVDFISSQLYLEGCTFNGTTNLEKTGATVNNCYGNNVFNSITTISNSGPANLVLANVLPDTYKKDVTFTGAGAGSLSVATSGVNNFEANLICNRTLKFNSGPTGVCNFTNTNLQEIKGTVEQIIPRLTINKASNKLMLDTNLTVSTLLTLINGYLDLNSKTLKLTNPAINSLIRTNGYILSEKTNNASKIAWTIGSTQGTHTFPFGNSQGDYIPFSFNLTSGDVGVVTVSTYATAADNTPYPVSPQTVTNLSNGIKSHEFVVDRFWQIDKASTLGTATLTFSYADSEVPLNGEATMQAQRYQKSNDLWLSPLVGQVNDVVANTVTVPGVSTFSPWTLVTSGVTAVEDGQNHSGIILYPNPVIEGFVQIELPEIVQDEVKISLYNSLGKEIFSQVRQGIMMDSFELDLGRELNPGTYLLLIQSKKSSYKKSLLIK